MNKIFILATLLFAAVSCSKEATEVTNEPTDQSTETTSITLTAPLSDTAIDTRVSANTTDNEDAWTFSWESGDAMLGWHTDCVRPMQLTLQDLETSTFTGELGEGEYHRFVYPYENFMFRNSEAFTMDISEQDGKLNKTYLINDAPILTEDINNGTVTSLTMEHLGGFMVVDIFLKNFDTTKSYTLKSLLYCGLPTSANINLSDDTYEQRNNDEESITATLDGFDFKEVVYNGTNYLQSIVNLNILPFSVASGESIYIYLDIEISDDTTTETKSLFTTITNSSDSDIPFDKGTHNFTYITIDGANEVNITDCTINDWTIVDSENDLSASEASTYTLSEIDENNIPSGNVWIITDSELTYGNTNGLFYALGNTTGNKTLIFPNAISVGEYALSRTSKIFKISLPVAETIGERAFYECVALSSIELPKVTTIGERAFYKCVALSSIELPKATTIGERAFYKCVALSSIELPEATTIGEGAFISCYDLTIVNIPKETTIGDYAFHNCYTLSSIDMSEVTTIGDYAFSYCYALSSIDMPEATTIGVDAFSYCRYLSSVNLPKATTIGEGAFKECSALKTLKLTSADKITYGSGLVSGSYANYTTLYLNSNEVNSALATEYSWKEVIYVDSDGNEVTD